MSQGKRRPTRERILAAATALFHEKGYAATGMAEILQRADANSGSFYHFFSSKEDVLGAVLDQYQEMLYPVLLDPIWKTTPDPIDRIFRLLARYREILFVTKFSYGCPIGRIALEVDASMKPIHRKLAANFDGWKAAVQQCLEEARNEGRLPSGVDCQRLACLVLSVMEGGVMQARSYGNARPFDQSVGELRQYFAALAQAAPDLRGRRGKLQKKRS
jgi:TetR/AcrR family transcriptional repressor of nem operon